MGFVGIISEIWGIIFVMEVCMESENISRLEGDFIMFLH